MSRKFIYDTVKFRARCVAVESAESVLLNVDTGFNGYRIIPFKLYGVKETKEEAVDFLWDILIGDDDTEWPLSIQTFVDPDDNNFYLVKINVETYTDNVGTVVCVNQLMISKGLSKLRRY